MDRPLSQLPLATILGEGIKLFKIYWGLSGWCLTTDPIDKIHQLAIEYGWQWWHESRSSFRYVVDGKQDWINICRVRGMVLETPLGYNRWDDPMTACQEITLGGARTIVQQTPRWRFITYTSEWYNDDTQQTLYCITNRPRLQCTIDCPIF